MGATGAEDRSFDFEMETSTSKRQESRETKDPGQFEVGYKSSQSDVMAIVNDIDISPSLGSGVSSMLDSNPNMAFRNDNVHQPTTPEVAICGIGLRLPGGIRNCDDFWDVLENGKDTRSAIPSTRYNIEGFDDSLGGKDAIRIKHGYFLDEDLSKLDTTFFSLAKNELEKMDPQQRLLLEVVRESLEDAGEVDYRGNQVGCYVGTFGEDWLMMSAKDPQQGGGYLITGHGDLMLANRISYEYDFHGPSMLIRTGCSSSLLGLHEAFRAIQNGDANAAIVAGASMIITPTITSAMSAGNLLAVDGSCKSFDAAADGYARAEAVVVVYIKRLSDAIRDGNPIRAIIKGTATNCDGRSQSLVTPNGAAQEALIRKAYEHAGLNPQDTPFIECHGTGTPLGDPIETTAVGRVFGAHGVFIGSVKANIGHGEGCAGLSSVVKCVLALEHKIIPPNIKFNNPNPKIPFAQYRLTVPVVPTPFPQDRPERVSINSFGIGGTNAHAILESSPQILSVQNGMETQVATATTDGTCQSKPELLLFSANTETSLDEQICRHKEWILATQVSVADAAYTRAVHREHLPFRAFTIVDNRDFVESASGVKTPQTADPVVLVFSGQGAQWPGMGKEMILGDPEFRNDILKMDRALQLLSHPPQWNMVDEILKPDSSSQIHRAGLSQPICTAIQVALFNKFAALGVKPRAVVGHSSGEIAAAYVAGYISMDEAITTAYYRGYVATNSTLEGAMAAIGLGSHELSGCLVDGVVVACENSPKSSTLSGDADQVRRAVGLIKQKMPDVFTRILKVDQAYHSHHMRPLGAEYQQLLETDLKCFPGSRQSTTVDFFSSVTGRLMNGSHLDASYWTTNLTSSVRFSSATSLLLDHYNNVTLLEIGPHSALAGPLRQVCEAKSRPCNYLSALSRGKNCAVTFLSAIGRLYQAGVSLNLKPLFPHAKAMSGLPTYPWQHSESYWYEPRVSKAWRHRTYPHHALLGARILESTETEPQWRNLLQIEDEPWLADHKIQSNIVFPFAGYVALAGEAVRQLTHSSHDVGYHLRHVVAHTALSLSESVPTELFTTLRQQKLNDHEESGWFDFSITSYNGSRWVKHCDGLVRIGRERTPSASAPKLLPRNVNCSQVYENMAKVGFMYGPEFRGLTNITASATDEAANGQIINRNTDSRGPFTLHPAVIDAGLQLLLVAKIKGLSRNIIELCLPTSIDEMEIGPASDVMDAKAWNLYGYKESPCVECVSDGKLVLHASGVEFRPLSDDKALNFPDPHATARLRWLPDFDFVDKSTLFVPPTIEREVTQLQEELALCCILESAERVRCLEPCQPHYAKYRYWMDEQISLAAAGNYKLVKHSSEYVKLPGEQRLEAINNLTSKLMEKRNTAFTVGLRRTFDNIEKLFTGEARVLDVLLRDNILAKIYDNMTFDYAKFVQLLAHARPNLRILEVGAGTGGTTETITRSLGDVGGLPVYSTYTFTDISAGFFPSARERFAHVSNMEFKVFDVTKDPAEQGLQAGSYDLVLASNVLHATPSIRNTLVNVEKLLMPDGMLVMTEICQMSWRSNYIFGNFAGWWLGEADGRPDQPFISLSRWDEELKAVGFTGVDMAMHEAADPYRQFAVITSRRQAKEKTKTTKVSVMSVSSTGEVACSLAAALQERGWEATIFSLTDELPQDGDIISCVDLETNFFEDLSANKFTAFQSLLGSMGSKKLLWLTRPVQMNCRDPQTAQSIGVARTIRSELGLNFSTLEIDVNEEHFSSLVVSVFNKVCAEEDKGSLESDKEFAVDNSVVYIGRYHPFSLLNEMPKSSDGCQTQLVKYLDIETPGMLDTLTWKSHLFPETITEDHVEINVHSAGLNFRDVVYAMGLLVYKESRAPLGMEVAGTVRRVGSAVTAFAVGDRVMSFTNCNGFSTQLVVPDHSVLKIPENMTFEEAATIPGCFLTAIQALLDVGRLRKGMSVLIHSACGGVGLAAIQVAQMVGAEIFASVGTEKKVKHLIAKYNVPRDHIFTSRNLSFLEGVMQQTSGKGVDLVLNSLKGDLLHASWKCVAKNGALLELGKRDLADHGQLDMSRFLDNRSYCGVDLAHLVQEEPLAVRDILRRALDFFERGLLKPLDPITVFDAVDVEDAFRYLQAGEHIGKVILNLPADASSLKASPDARQVSFNPNSAYLLVGGLGGLGRSLATWLVEKGAKHLVFLSRNAGISANSAFAAELESMGCSTTMIKGSVNNIKDVKEAIRVSPAPIRGVFHLAMVQRDSSFLDLRWMDWVDANKPKVKGTWNLHEAFLGHTLDFFWLASSLVTVVDQPGQGNYKAGCTFIEAFCQYRHSLGLPASVLCICPIDDVGYVAENPHALRASKMQGLHFCGEREFLDCVEFSILNQSPREAERHNDVEYRYRTPWTSSGQLIMGLRSELHLDDPKNPTNWRRDRRMGLYHNVPVKEESKFLGESKGLKQLLQSLHSGNAEGTLVEESIANFIAVEIGRKVNDFLLKRHAKIDVSLTLSEMGLDSLTAIELRRWFRQILGLQISVLRIMESASLRQLGQNVADMLKEKYTS